MLYIPKFIEIISVLQRKNHQGHWRWHIPLPNCQWYFEGQGIRHRCTREYWSDDHEAVLPFYLLFSTRKCSKI